jgi:hypothetical protein
MDAKQAPARGSDASLEEDGGRRHLIDLIHAFGFIPSNVLRAEGVIYGFWLGVFGIPGMGMNTTTDDDRNSPPPPAAPIISARGP